MININVHYANKQEAFIKEAKKNSGKSWPEFFLAIAGYNFEKEKE